MATQVSFFGIRSLVFDCPSSCRTRFIRSAASDRSKMVNDGLRPMWLANSRNSRAPTAWKVPDHGRSIRRAPDIVTVRRARRRDHTGADMFCKLNGEAGDAARTALNQNRLARLQFQRLLDGTYCRETGESQGGGVNM